jgi:hypothetical protein
MIILQIHIDQSYRKLNYFVIIDLIMLCGHYWRSMNYDENDIDLDMNVDKVNRYQVHENKFNVNVNNMNNANDAYVCLCMQ